VSTVRRGGVLEGATVLVALASVPLALVMALHAPVVTSLVGLVDGLVAAAAVSWVAVSVGLARLVVRQVRVGSLVDTGPLAWAAVRVAAVVLLVAPFLETAHGQRAPTPVATPPHVLTASAIDRVAPVTVRAPGAHRPGDGEHRCRHAPVSPVPLGTGPLLVPLAAVVRRRTRLGRRLHVGDERAVDVETALLAAPAPPTALLSDVARALAAAGRLAAPAHVILAEGEARLDGEAWRFDPSAPRRETRCFVVVLGDGHDGTHVVLVPRGAVLALGGTSWEALVGDAVRVGGATGLGRPRLAGADGLQRSLALREDDELVVCTAAPFDLDDELAQRCVVVDGASLEPLARVSDDEVRLADGRRLVRASLSPDVRALLEGAHDTTAATASPRGGDADDDVADGVVVRLLTPVPRVDGLVATLASGRERRAVELLAYLALRAGEPVTGERLRVRVLGTPSTDAASKTLFNVASGLRRALGDGPFGPRLPPAGRAGRYAVARDVRCDVTVLEARCEMASRCDVDEERMAWLRAALELVEGEPFATVLEGYDWFLAEGHLTRLQTVCEDAACELVDLALRHGLAELAGLALDRAVLVDPYSERLADAAVRVASAQASFDAIDPAERSTVPSAPATT
jgi:hypothetical protein